MGEFLTVSGQNHDLISPVEEDALTQPSHESPHSTAKVWDQLLLDHRDVQFSPYAVRSMRSLLHLGQEDFALAIGVDRYSIWRWEKGRLSPRGLSRKALLEKERDLSQVVLSRFNQGLERQFRRNVLGQYTPVTVCRIALHETSFDGPLIFAYASTDLTDQDVEKVFDWHSLGAAMYLRERATNATMTMVDLQNGYLIA